jgi:hypothetical protein
MTFLSDVEGLELEADMQIPYSEIELPPSLSIPKPVWTDVSVI